MQALLLTTADGLDSVELANVDTPEPAEGEVRVAIKAASLNHRELWITKGLYPGMQLPATLGCDGAGVVESVGAGVDASLVGTEVVIYPGLDNWGDDARFPAPEFALLGMPGPGTVAEYICVPAAHVSPKPEYLSFEEAAAIPLAALTAWRGLFTKANLQAGEKVLITGVGGGVATFALMFAKAVGAIPYVTSGSDDTLAKAKEYGAVDGFNYRDENWRKAVGKTTGGIDVVFDGAPASSFANYTRALNMGARVVLYGSTGGMDFKVMATDIFLKNLSVIGTNVGNLQEFNAMFAFVEKHQLKPVMDRNFGFGESKEALQYLSDSHQFGKVTITA